MPSGRLFELWGKEIALRLPLIVKPLLSTGKKRLEAITGYSIKGVVIRDREALQWWLAELDLDGEEFLAQEYIEGEEDAIYSYHAYVDENGAVLGFYVGRKIRTNPASAGFSTCIELVRDTAVAEAGCRLIRQLQLQGPVKIDFKRDAVSGELFLLELNLCFTLWNQLGTACGVNLLQIAHRHLCGGRSPVPTAYRTGVAWISFESDLRSVIKWYLPEGKLTVLSWLRSLMRPKVYAIFSWRDPLPALISSSRLSWRAVRKLLAGAKPHAHGRNIGYSRE